jgi:hypothetical protein
MIGNVRLQMIVKLLSDLDVTDTVFNHPTTSFLASFHDLTPQGETFVFNLLADT